jgi:phosphate-selective porin OprO/OprP
MAFGRLFDKKVDYAVGIYNGARNGFLAQSDGKAISAFINYKPFNGEENTLLENFNVGGSVFAVNSFSGLDNPQILRTMVPTTGNAIVGVPFLAFNNNTRESGFKAFWDLHLAWFYQQLSVVAEYGSGGQDYAPATQLATRTRVPVSSFYVQSSYFLTGETAAGFGIVKPLHNFDLRTDKFGLGAWELVTRFQMLNIGENVFTSGLADPNLWSNHLWASDFGFNWHMTQYVKVMFQWEHAEFGSPVQYAPGKRQLTSDMFLLRCQLYF